MQRNNKKTFQKGKKIVKDKKYSSKHGQKEDLEMVPIDVSHKTGTPD